MTIEFSFIANDRTMPAGKLADAEIFFLDGPLAGLRLIGFAVWQRRTGGGFNVTFPARQYAINGERRSFALLRPSGLSDEGRDRFVGRLLEAFEAWRDAAAVAS